MPTCVYATTLACVLILTIHGQLVAGSSGTPFFRPRHNGFWRSNEASFGRRSQGGAYPGARPLSLRSQAYIDKIAAKEMPGYSGVDNVIERFPPRGGEDSDTFVKVVGIAADILVQCGRVVLPPIVALTKMIVGFYQALPKDAIMAQVGLVYCFAGGYYPTLFSSLAAAQQFGWDVMVEAIQDLTDEAINVIHALEEVQTSKYGFDDDRAANSFRRNTAVVMATVDPQKVNQAAGALYTTWVGVSSVLEKEYARVITLSLTMARYIERLAQFILAPPARMCVAADYHRWIPVVIGWGCKAAAMNVAWRIQRVMSAATSAITGGLMFARACARMLSKRGVNMFGLIQEDDEATFFDEVIGFMVAGLGFYTQFEAQYRNRFSFKVPYPFNLVTWPFDLAEKWIQWQITKE
ncbi:expressed unknown protein [Seminavis robusta]|uniref:Uncharacterized protein n=1 Tax=Seminavis robusta TaxID=568900 RepID=A0A9N8HXF0_9STRA|nr:expressed unknown protein [Seminavis robusta]|eukprot:Sro2196_g318580.1 n/a (408) ;mRNA; r:212-1623